MWASSPSDAWLAGNGSCWHYDGTSWVPYQDQPCLYGISPIWGFAPDDVWSTIPNGLALHWDGQSWTQEGPSNPREGGYASVWGSGPSDLYVVGSFGQGDHYDGTSWTALPNAGQSLTLLEIRGSSATNIWAVAQDENGVPGEAIVVMRYWP